MFFKARLEALLGSERGEALCSEGVAEELSMADVYDMDDDLWRGGDV